MWPKEYGGADLGKEEFMIWIEELRQARARTPLAGMGTGLIGPTILEYGTHEQKLRHLVPISRGEFRWCQGYSEPSAGSDLASLRTRAEDKGDHFLVNGQKIWTSGAQVADWIFVLVRTDPDVPKHEGISFLLMDMDQPGITPRPIQLISGNSPFCETFFDNAIGRKDDLLGEINKGWTVGKRLLQHERSSISSLVGGQRRDPGPRLADVAKRYLGDDEGRIAHAEVRARVIHNELNGEAFRLTQKRTVEETKEATTPGPATSMFKVYGTELTQQRIELMRQIRGVQGLGWDGDMFSEEEKEGVRSWLSSRAMSIYSGSNEIQRNIIAKRVLGLPD
jgi:alkylation response protein AidB-like acyl-CoA dehydrogenase